MEKWSPWQQKFQMEFMYSKHFRNWGRFKILLKSFMFLLCWDGNIFWGEEHFCFVKELSGMRFRA